MPKRAAVNAAGEISFAAIAPKEKDPATSAENSNMEAWP
jgi:hypothetical protein